MNKTRWSDVTEAELAASGKVKRPSQRYGNAFDRAREQYPAVPGHPLEGTTIAPVRSKYRNVRCVVQGERFDSQREADVWLGLLARQSAGEIKELRRQVEFPLYAPVLDADGMVKPGEAVQIAKYVADFTYLEMNISGNPDGFERVIDAKGLKTQTYRLKKKWLELQSGIEIVEV